MSISRKAMMEQRHMHCILHCRDMKDFIFRADQTIALVEYFLEHYNIDQEKVYASGYSGGGETMSITDRNRQYRLTRHCMIYMKNRD